MPPSQSCGFTLPLLASIGHNLQMQRRKSDPIFADSIQADLQKIRIGTWWSWSNTVVVVLLLTCTMVSFSLPSLYHEIESPTDVRVNLAIRGLVGLVLLF